MEGVAESGGGDWLASGAVHASDLDILRDNPGAAASLAAPWRHDREAARAKPVHLPVLAKIWPVWKRQACTRQGFGKLLALGIPLHDMPDLLSLSVLSTGQRLIPWSTSMRIRSE